MTMKGLLTALLWLLPLAAPFGAGAQEREGSVVDGATGKEREAFPCESAVVRVSVSEDGKRVLGVTHLQ